MPLPLVVKQAIQIINSSVGPSALFFQMFKGHYGSDFSQIDPFNIDGYQYNPDDGIWYADPPAPVIGDFSWDAPASDDKQTELTWLRDLTIAWQNGELDMPLNGAQKMSDSFNNATNPPRRDPLALDLDGDGIETVAANGYNGAMFDMDGDGVRTATGWVKGDDGILVWDKNHDGQVNDGTELFAHFGDVSHMNQLTDVNGNGDGVVDASDAAFADLRVWRDLNGDGKGQGGELFTLDELGIASLNTTLTAQTTNLGNGNTQLSSGAVNYTNGATGAMGDLALQEQTIYSDFTDTVTPTAAALALPGLRGMGCIRHCTVASSVRW